MNREEQKQGLDGHLLVFLTNEYYPKIGGAATVVHEMANVAVSKGAKVRVLAPGDTRLPAMTGAVYDIERLGHRGKQDWLARLTLLRALARRKCEQYERWIIAEPGALRAMMYAHFFGVTIPQKPVVILHGSEILRYTACCHRRFLLRKLLESCDYVHLLSHANADLLLKRIPGLRATIEVLPGAPSRKPAQGRMSDVRKCGRIVFLTVGRIHPRKGQLDTLKALSMLPPSMRAKISYHIVGPVVRKSFLKKIQKLAATCDFPVEIRGSISEESLEDAYREADVFIMNSRQAGYSVEGFGLTYLDASLYGLPVVANRTGGVAEAVLEGETGLLVQEGDLNSLSRACADLIENEDKRKRLGETGRQFAESHSWENSVRPLMS